MTLHDFSIKAIREHVESRGYVLTSKSAFDWETPAQFSRRHGWHENWFCKAAAKGHTPPFERSTPKGKRLVLLRSNPELEIFAARGNKSVDIAPNINHNAP